MPPSDDTWDAADWQPQQWDGEKWVDAGPPAGAGGDGAGAEETGAGADEEAWEESWEYEEVAGDANRQRQLVVGAGATLTVLLLLAAVVVAFTGGSDPSSTATGPAPGSTTASTAGSTAPPRRNSPLTGLPGDAAKVGRPALVVKIDNADKEARPQSGINQADVVYEEKVEGTVSRFAAVFQSTDAASVGPVRSGRTTDLAILSALNRPLFAFSGANELLRPQINDADVIDLGADVLPGPYTRDDDREAPHNLYTGTEQLWALGMADRPPKPLFQYRKVDEGPRNGRPVAGAHYEWGGGKSGVDFTWDATGRAWQRFQNGTPHVDADGQQIAPANVVVLSVVYSDTGVRDAAGVAVPEAELVGEGDVMVFTDGQLVQGRWSKPTIDAVPVFADSSGEVIALTPGRTWVALVPKGLTTVVNRTDSPGQPRPSTRR